MTLAKATSIEGMRRLAALFLLVSCLGIATARAEPATSPWFVTDQGKVRLIAAATGVGGGDTVSLGLQFALAPGWKIYWRSPGDAGLPPVLDWSGSQNLADATLLWPAPRRFSAFGLETIGYEDDVVLPITARLTTPSQKLGLAAHLQYLTCKDICIPYEAELTLDLPAAGSDAGFAAPIGQALSRVPGYGNTGVLQLVGARLHGGKEPTLELTVASTGAPLQAPDAFVDAPHGMAFAAPRVALGRGGKEATLVLPVSASLEPAESLAGKQLTVTVVDGPHAVEATTVPGLAPPPRDASLLLAMVGVALLGGLVLNVMPCVLPVLSIKLLSVAGKIGRSRGAIRRGFLATAAGIVTMFLALAAAMIALQSAGLAVGWGVQFQQPIFLVAMAAIVTLFACNLAGLFEIALPQVLGGLATVGATREAEGSHLGDFAAGAFATLLATPCSAPFLGTAVGFALAGDASDIVVIFLALGIGLALPYLVVAALPSLASRLPRPGRWMVTLRRILALCLAATALWLLWVLAAQIGTGAALAALVALLLMPVLLRSVAQPSLRRAGIVSALLLAVALPPALSRPVAPRGAERGPWQAFDRAGIDRAVKAGKTVFVDVTAEWCLNCKINERIVLQSDAVARRLASADIVAMRADWTRPNAAIAEFLRDFDRYGIPFYAVYGPATPSGQPLAEILTPSSVLAALDRARPPRDGG
ncbi:MAG: suppressor for copper-sensitivity [Rhodospirillales bacterium]|nr:suppressor for copper-sensitivity [Rhodospirillales bacterium]